jgi:hypothetical protein
MDANTSQVLDLRIESTIKALEKNHMRGEYLPKKEDVVPRLKELIAPGASCAVGGSQSLSECGVLELLRNGAYTFYDRYAPGLDQTGVRKVFLQSFDADVYLASANAVTEHGELYCVDNTGNRVAAMLYGPKQVILIVSTDKIVPDLAAAVVRVKRLAGPANAIRLKRNTFCTSAGHCMRDVCDDHHLMALPAGACPETVCSDAVVFSNQRTDGRIRVLFVGQSIGY